jgi:hypothetical protein
MRALTEDLVKDTEAGTDILYKICNSTWWNWKSGSTLIFWRWHESVGPRTSASLHTPGTPAKARQVWLDPTQHQDGFGQRIRHHVFGQETHDSLGRRYELIRRESHGVL